MPAGLPVTHTKLLCVPKLYARRHYLPPHLLRGPSHNCFWAVMTVMGVDTMFPKQGTVFCCVRSRLTLWSIYSLPHWRKNWEWEALCKGSSNTKEPEQGYAWATQTATEILAAGVCCVGRSLCSNLVLTKQ